MNLSEIVIFDCGQPANFRWEVVNDDVMGGVSTSHFHQTHHGAVFSGKLALENNGGFASVRTAPLSLLTLPAADRFRIRVRGDGQRYKFTVRDAADQNNTLYQLAFATIAGEWQNLEMPLKEFVPTFRGRVLHEASALQISELMALGFLISDKQAGAFRLEIAWIKLTKPTG